MSERSAGILLFRKKGGMVEVLLAHPGGPFWAKKDEGAWSIPKGEIAEDEDEIAAAWREFFEETGLSLRGELLRLGAFRQPSGKLVAAFALEADVDANQLRSNTCQIEWPPKSGRAIEIPEVDRLEWFALHVAMTRIAKGQRPILQALTEKLGSH
jgi:predicted NUDIX family NTP pyrophosphohydrolase